MALETFLWLRVGLAWGINGQEFTSENSGTEQYIQNMSLYTVISGSHGDEPQVIPPYYPHSLAVSHHRSVLYCFIQYSVCYLLCILCNCDQSIVPIVALILKSDRRIVTYCHGPSLFQLIYHLLQQKKKDFTSFWLIPNSCHSVSIHYQLC